MNVTSFYMGCFRNTVSRYISCNVICYKDVQKDDRIPLDLVNLFTKLSIEYPVSYFRYYIDNIDTISCTYLSFILSITSHYEGMLYVKEYISVNTVVLLAEKVKEGQTIKLDEPICINVLTSVYVVDDKEKQYPVMLDVIHIEKTSLRGELNPASQME